MSCLTTVQIPDDVLTRLISDKQRKQTVDPAGPIPSLQLFMEDLSVAILLGAAYGQVSSLLRRCKNYHGRRTWMTLSKAARRSGAGGGTQHLEGVTGERQRVLSSHLCRVHPATRVLLSSTLTCDRTL